MQNNVTQTASTDLVLEQLPSGEHAWLRPTAATTDASLPAWTDALAGVAYEIDCEEPAGYLTDQGRLALAHAALFGPWPRVSQA